MRRVLFLLFFFLFVFHQKAYASNFTTDYKVTYTVDNSAKTRVNLDVTLTNTTEQYYASSYIIEAGFKDISNVKASDPDGSINPVVNKTSKGQNVKLDFNKRVVGLGNKLNFNLSFDTNEVASANGNVWEINIPGLSNQGDFSSFNVTVFYPGFLGRPAFIKPDVSNVRTRNSGNRLDFGKNDLGSSGISIAFGQFQTYSFNLSYHLENKNLFPVSTEIALPPDTNYQDIAIDDLSPKPQNVKTDEDGNWLAKYILKPSQNLEVHALGKARVYLEPKKEIVNPNLLNNDLQPKKYWETIDPKIKDLAMQLKTPRAIYQYTVDNLTYDFTRVQNGKGRAGAANILKEPTSAVCLEFADLFVTLSRAAGIPARELNGFANTKNTQERPLSLVKDVLHAWPEYYDKDKEAWIMVDPTWGNTTNGIDYYNTLDFDHFTFVVKGKDSDYPVPAGGYKRQQDESLKDVDVSVTEGFDGNYNLETNLNFPNKILPGFESSGSIRIRNTGKIMSLPTSLKILSNVLTVNRRTVDVAAIPPYGYIDIPVNFNKTPILTNKEDVITIQLGNNAYQRKILISPFVADKLTIGGVLVFAATILSFIITRSGRLPFFRRKR